MLKSPGGREYLEAIKRKEFAVLATGILEMEQIAEEEHEDAAEL